LLPIALTVVASSSNLLLDSSRSFSTLSFPLSVASDSFAIVRLFFKTAIVLSKSVLSKYTVLIISTQRVKTVLFDSPS
jgi:hypothetical protein